ncbi:MAG: hypothetical protein QOF03_377 [Alphaproteobacteria bacterium]|jgi:hypothetical protein|nr:hypothetical protein [Alphaproteobacteria bacterium]
MTKHQTTDDQRKDGKGRPGGAPSPTQERETTRENQNQKGSGEGQTGMQRGAGHPTGR